MDGVLTNRQLLLSFSGTNPHLIHSFLHSLNILNGYSQLALCKFLKVQRPRFWTGAQHPRMASHTGRPLSLQALNDGKMNVTRVLDHLAFTALKARTLSCLLYNAESNLESVCSGGAFVLARCSAVSCPLTPGSNLFDGYAGNSSSFKHHPLLLTCGNRQRADVAHAPDSSVVCVGSGRRA